MKILAALLLAFTLVSARGQPLLVHVHGLAFSPDGKALLVSSHAGLTAFRDGTWSSALESELDFSGFSVAERAMYASGHPSPGVRLRNPLGLARSLDGGHSWESLALEGEADFHLIAASYRTPAIYVLNHLRNSAMPAPGLYVTRDEGQSWTRAAARGLDGEILALAAHPREPDVVAAATDAGLYLSGDAGERFRRLRRRQAVTAVMFDLDGAKVRYAPALSTEMVALPLDRRGRETMRLPALGGDYVTHLAVHPADAKILAVATRRRNVFLTTDGGAIWRQIAKEGDLP